MGFENRCTVGRRTGGGRGLDRMDDGLFLERGDGR